MLYVYYTQILGHNSDHFIWIYQYIKCNLYLHYIHHSLILPINMYLYTNFIHIICTYKHIIYTSIHTTTYWVYTIISIIYIINTCVYHIVPHICHNHIYTHYILVYIIYSSSYYSGWLSSIQINRDNITRILTSFPLPFIYDNIYIL